MLTKFPTPGTHYNYPTRAALQTVIFWDSYVAFAILTAYCLPLKLLDNILFDN
jgi:hypothetical protein